MSDGEPATCVMASMTLLAATTYSTASTQVRLKRGPAYTVRDDNLVQPGKQAVELDQRPGIDGRHGRLLQHPYRIYPGDGRWEVDPKVVGDEASPSRPDRDHQDGVAASRWGESQIQNLGHQARVRRGGRIAGRGGTEQNWPSQKVCPGIFGVLLTSHIVSGYATRTAVMYAASTVMLPTAGSALTSAQSSRTSFASAVV